MPFAGGKFNIRFRPLLTKNQFYSDLTKSAFGRGSGLIKVF